VGFCNTLSSPVHVHSVLILYIYPRVSPYLTFLCINTIRDKFYSLFFFLADCPVCSILSPLPPPRSDILPHPYPSCRHSIIPVSVVDSFLLADCYSPHFLLGLLYCVNLVFLFVVIISCYLAVFRLSGTLVLFSSLSHSLWIGSSRLIHAFMILI